MKKVVVLAFIITLVTGLCFAQTRITESLSNWTLGTNAPEIATGPRGDGTSGGYIHMLVGTISGFTTPANAWKPWIPGTA
jgi:hypothetical protein